MVSACDSGGTSPDPSEDSFTADITVTSNAAPATGTFDSSVDSGVKTVNVTAFVPGVMFYTFMGITMDADGTPIDITASFVGDATCTSTFKEAAAGLAPASYSTTDHYNAVASGNSDNDEDGVSDICDLDDDNDGILETV